MEVGQVIVVGRVEHSGLQRRGQRGESFGVHESSEQDGVVRALHLPGLDIQRRRAADEVQHRHHRGQLVPFGQAGPAERGQPGVEPGQLTGVGGRTGRRGRQDPGVAVVDVPQPAGPIRKAATPVRGIVGAGGGPGAVESMNITSSSLLATCR